MATIKALEHELAKLTARVDAIDLLLGEDMKRAVKRKTWAAGDDQTQPWDEG